MSRPTLARELQEFVDDPDSRVDNKIAAGRQLRALLAYVRHAMAVHEGDGLCHPRSCKSCRLIVRLRSTMETR